MIIKVSLQLLTIFAMTTVCIYSKEYVLEDLIAMEDSNRRNTPNADAINSNNDSEQQKITRQRQTFSVRQKKADEGNNGVEKVESTNENGSKKMNKDDDDEDKKTLAQQVADGKYGLIQREIFPETPKRPGIISYEVNPEVPRDNVNNLGGLKPEEIWLAENHLLVLAGGGKYSDNRDGSHTWPPIDNYRAPPRQVKIPPNPKVPPPFPVQLRPGGPTEFIRGENGTGGPPQFPPLFPPVNFSGTGPPQSPFYGPPPGFHPGNFTPGNGPATPFPYPFPQPPPGIRNGSIPRLPPPGLFPQGLPPGANFLPPPGNFTEQFDEDDPSIYYPPPYDFVYKRENTTSVPPGPLVPGIVLPPPPDFFAPLEDEKRPKPKRPQQKSKRPLQIPTDYRGKSEYRFPTTTRRPSLQIVTDEPAHQPHLNEVTPETLEHVLPPNAEVRGWVPIPAPRPFYITGPRKPLVKNPNLENTRTNGYQFDRPYPSAFVDQNLNNGWNFIDNRSQPDSFNANYNENGHRGEGNILIIPTTTIPPVPYQSTQSPPKLQAVTRGKAVKSYYFYDEPSRIISTPPPPVQLGPLFNTPQPIARNPQYFTTTVSTSSPRPFQAEQPASPAPVQYFYITKRPQPIESSTSKPPIYEYSYTAPGYGTIEAPKLTGVSTPVPPVNQVPPIPQYDLNNYYQLYDAPQSSTRPTAGITFSTTAAPPIFQTSTIRPDTYEHTPKFNPKPTSSPYILQTENPYHAYFTHHDYSLIDDITRKYFTIFGQKINSADRATTPLSQLISVDEVTTKATIQKQKNKVKFPADQRQTPAPPSGLNDYSYYWNSPRPPSASGPVQNAYPQYPSDYDYYDDTNNYNGQNDYRYKYLQDLYNFNSGRHSAALVQQQQSQPSYEGDTRVNFVQPLPQKDPDAEEFEVVPLKNRHQQSRPGQNYVARTRTNSVPAPSLQDDTKVNFVSPPPTPEPDAEVYDPTKLKYRYQQYENAYGGRPQNNVVTLRPPSLHDDTRVNYASPLPSQDPDAEVFDPTQLKLGYRNRGSRPSNLYLLGRPQQQQQQQQQSQQLAGLVQSQTPSPRPPSLEGDINVNYLHPRPPVNPDAEIFNPKTRQQIITNLFQEFVGRAQGSLHDDTKVNDALKGQTPDPDALVFDPNNPPRPDFSGRRGQSDIIAYRLPGNGGHFYFLTPQTADQKQEVDYQSQDALQQNLFRRNVRRQSGSQEEQSDDSSQETDERQKQARRNRTEERRRNHVNRNININRSANSNSNTRNNNDNHRT